MDERPVYDNKIDQFKDWFVNVYWFHYKTNTIVIALITVAAISMIYSIAFQPRPAVTVVIAAEFYFDEVYNMFLAEDVKALVREKTGKRNAVIDFAVLSIAHGSLHGQASAMLLSTRLADERTLLYILGDSILYGMLDGEDDFQSLEPYGFGDVKLIDVTDAPRIHGLTGGKVDLYAGFITRDKMDDEIVQLSLALLEFLMTESEP